MHPDPQLAGLLGLASAGGTLANAYLRVDTSTAPGAGIVDQTIQFHGSADRYSLSGASAIATLYSDPTTATTNPAVSLRSVGPNGGQAAAFTYDLARSIVYTRQGNPAWAQDDRDGDGIRRTNDLFFGAKAGDVQPDWVNLDKFSIPQADEQQRLLANLVERMNADRKPLPKFWYLPRDEKAVVVMTGDDHGGSGTVGRLNGHIAASPPGCSVADWECVRSSSYIYPGTNITDAQAASLTAAGFEIGLHPNTNDSDWTPESLDAYFDGQMEALAQQLPSIPPPDSSRQHRVAWSDWATMPKVELDHGIRLDDSYYFFPASWAQNRPGFMTGSGIPMRFADLDGTTIDVFQATTQMTDESGQSYPFTIDSLLDKALGSEGYYGVFTANMHTDLAASSGSDAIVASAQAHGVPVVSGRQMLTWLDGRDSLIVRVDLPGRHHPELHDRRGSRRQRPARDAAGLVGGKPPCITDSGREPGDIHDGDHQGHRVRLVPSGRWRVLGGLPARHDRPRHLERDCRGRARWNRHRDVVDQRALGLPHRVRHDPRSARPQRDGSIPGHLPQHAAFRAQPEHDVSLPGHVSRRGNELIDATGTAGTAGQFRRAVGRFHRHHYVRLLGGHDRYGHLRVGVGQR